MINVDGNGYENSRCWELICSYQVLQRFLQGSYPPVSSYICARSDRIEQTVRNPTLIIMQTITGCEPPSPLWDLLTKHRDLSFSESGRLNRCDWWLRWPWDSILVPMPLSLLHAALRLHFAREACATQHTAIRSSTSQLLLWASYTRLLANSEPCTPVAVPQPMPARVLLSCLEYRGTFNFWPVTPWFGAHTGLRFVHASLLLYSIL